MKCLYWYSSYCDVEITVDGDGNFRVKINPKSDIDDNQFRSGLLKDLNDYNLRDIIAKETQPIRELIAAKAFSNGEFDEEPFGELDDPLGIKFL